MKEKFVNALTNFVIKNKNVDDLKIKTIRYGLESLYLSFTKLFVVFLLALITDCLIEFLLLLFFYQLIRKFSFGLHANTTLACWMTTIPIYVGGSLIIKYIFLNYYIIFTIWILAFFSFLLWAPADTPKRPLIRKNQRKTQKLKTCCICVFYLLLLLIFKNTSVINAITLSLFIQMIMVNPLVYKITNTRFNNYKIYPNKV